jgi:SAM-dependent methyltransferase
VTEHAFGDATDYEAWFTTAIGAFVDDLECGALGHILGDTAPGVVADIGAGTGHFARVLAVRHEIIAVEPSLVMCHEGRSRGAGLPIRWCAGVGEHLPLAECSVDGALVMTTLAWVEDPQRCVVEARRVVRPGGWLVIGFLSALSPWAALYRGLADEGIEPWSSARFFTRVDIENLVGAAPVSAEGVVHLAPQACEPWAAAEEAGRRAGNHPALEVLRWNLTT